MAPQVKRAIAPCTEGEGAKGREGCTLVAQEMKCLSSSLFSFLSSHQPSPGLPRPPQPPLPVIHGHLLPASDFSSSSSVHHCPPLSQPPLPQLHANLPRDRVTKIWSPVRDRPASRSHPFLSCSARGQEPPSLMLFRRRPPRHSPAPAGIPHSGPVHPRPSSPRLAAAVLTLTGLCRDPRGGGSPLSPQTLRRNPLRVRGRWGPSAQSAGRSLASPRLDGIRWQRRPSSTALGSARCPPPIAHRRRRRGGGGGRRAGEGEGQSGKRRGSPAGLSSRGVFEYRHLPWAVWQSLDARVVSCLPSLYGRGN